MSPPRLTFFCELDAGALQARIADPAVTEHLRALGAGVSLGLVDLGTERAEVVRRLNEAGVPLTAWLLLPMDQGYWFHQDNAPQAADRYEAFRAWTATHGVRWEGVGLDIEPDIHELRRALESPWRALPALLPRLLRGERLRRAREAYGALVERIRADGYRVESYQFPFIVDERRAGSTLLQRLSGVLALPVDREVLMLYSSFAGRHGPGALWSYGPDAQAIAVGITGGGVELPDSLEVKTLGWEELTRDLRLARRWTDDIGIFSLEGCVRQGLLARLRDFDWEGPVEAPPEGARLVERVRRVAGGVLRASALLLR
jgi:hypothetical protein